MSRRQAALCLTAGLLLVVAAPVARAGLARDPAGQRVTELNAAAATALVTPPAAAGPDPATTPPAAPAPDPPTLVAVPPPAPATTTATSSRDTAPEPAAVVADPAPVPGDPTRLQVPALGIDSPVVPVGVAASGDLEIPADVDDIGWYRYGPAPGTDVGSAVLTGHVDSRRQGPGPFSRLGELAEGDLITVVDDVGAVRSFTVLAREEWPKSEVPVDRIFDRGGSARLVLITCGGDFDAGTGHYRDNIAITAVPAAETQAER